MALLSKSKAPTIDPDGVYISWDSFAWRDDIVNRGDRLRGSAPVVQSVFEKFVPDGTPASEMPTPWDSILEENEQKELERQAQELEAFKAEAKANRVKLEAPVVRCTEDFAAWHAGRPTLILKGSQTITSDPLVINHPDRWRS